MNGKNFDEIDFCESLRSENLLLNECVEWFHSNLQNTEKQNSELRVTYSKDKCNQINVIESKYLDNLSSEVLAIIFSFCDTSTLFSLRKVSKKLKSIADLMLQTRREELIISSNHCDQQIATLCNIFQRSKKLCLLRPSLPVPIIMELYSEKLKTVESITMCTNHNEAIVRSFNAHFSDLKSLLLHNYEANDKEIADLLRCVPNLVNLHVHGCKVNGDFLASIGNRVRTVQIYVTSSLNFEMAKLNNLDELIINCAGIDGDLTLMHEVTTVKKLTFNLSYGNFHERVGNFLSKFTKVDHLVLLNYGHEYFDEISSVIANWSSLRTFEFRDVTYFPPKKQIMLNELVELDKRLKYVNVFKHEVSLFNFERIWFAKQLREIANSRCNVLFEITILPSMNREEIRSVD